MPVETDKAAADTAEGFRRGLGLFDSTMVVVVMIMISLLFRL